MKYNDNGEYKDIYIKTFDTLPVGAEVDYDGETVPDGWSEIVPSKKVLWTNLTPTSSFAAQDLTIEDMTNYDYYEIIYKIWTGSNYQHSTGLIQNGASAFLSGIEITPSSNVGAYQSRKVDYISNTKLHFNDCYVENVYTNANTTISTANNIMVPMQIIGHKF